MASPTSPVAQSAPLRSPAKTTEELAHPVPDLQTLQGAYVNNIERLEEVADRMSEAGSDLGQEIKRTYSELKRSDSRRSSLQLKTTTRSRNVSTSSSIVDLNGTARWGGYSPGGYVTSPGGSLRSGSFSNHPTNLQRQRSGSKASRLGQVVHPDEVKDDQEDARSPTSPQQEDSSQPGQRKVSSFTRIYDEVANGLPEDLRNSVILGQPLNDEAERYASRDNPYQYASHNDLPDRPPTAASTDTTHQVRTLWQDFDGVHAPDTVPEEEPMSFHGGHSRQSSGGSFMMRSNPELDQMGAPPPEDGMVFYPAPVPRMLNLPKRLSQLPPTSVQAKRRTQLLESMQYENNRKSTVNLGDGLDDPLKAANRKSRQSLLGLPPQLRASAYFDQPAPAQEFAVKGESAEDTLDSILNASARAPVSAFTDHPFAGHVGNEVYGPEQKRKSTKFPDPPKIEETKRRSSFHMLDTKRNSSGDPLNKLKKRNSIADMNAMTVQASESRMSLADELDVHDEHARGPANQDDTASKRLSMADDDRRNPDDVYEEENLQPEAPDEEEEEQFFGAPTTLLAELQMRKAKQKTRNMNYATLVEQGLMTSHRTLLEMDDLAEREKQRRLKKKVQLAWEAQVEEDDSDDDVPLGMLYKQGSQHHEPHQPIGLIAQRELEDSEPLSKRRTRLLGADPHRARDLSPGKRGTHYLGTSPSQAHLTVPTTTTPGPESDEEEGETLAERMRRLKDKQMLDSALGDDPRKSTVSGDFAAEMLSRLRATEEEKPQPTPSPGAEEEETLGQRRTRLQAEAAARGEPIIQSDARPQLRQSMSLADVLGANPTNQARKVTQEDLVSHLPPGSLLHQNVLSEERKKTQRLTQMRASSFGGGLNPLLGNVADKNDDDVPLAAKIQAYKNKMAGVGSPPQAGGMQNMMFNNGMMGQNMSGMNLPGQDFSMMGMQQNPSMMNMPMMGMQPQMGMGFQYPQGNPGMMRQSSMMSMPMMGMNGMNGMNMGMPMNGMPMGMNMNMMAMQGQMMGPPMDPRQRDQINRWMQGINN